MADTIISREEARTQGLRHYSTGVPCKHGHTSPRLVSSRTCVECQTAWAAAHRATSGGAAKHRAATERYRENHPEKIKAALEVWRKENPDRIKQYNAERLADPVIRAGKYAKTREWRERNKDRVNAYQAAWRQANAEHVRASSRDYRANNYEKSRACIDKWQRDNPEKVREINRNRRARKKAAEGFHTAADIKDIYSMQKGRCAICRKMLDRKYHVDHIQPLARGGSNARRNLQLLCPTCNGRKHAQDPVLFMRGQGFLL